MIKNQNEFNQREKVSSIEKKNTCVCDTINVSCGTAIPKHLQGSSTIGDRHIPIFCSLTGREHFFLSIFHAKVINNLFRNRHRKKCDLQNKALDSRYRGYRKIIKFNIIINFWYPFLFSRKLTANLNSCMPTHIHHWLIFCLAINHSPTNTYFISNKKYCCEAWFFLKQNFTSLMIYLDCIC